MVTYIRQLHEYKRLQAMSSPEWRVNRSKWRHDTTNSLDVSVTDRHQACTPGLQPSRPACVPDTHLPDTAAVSSPPTSHREIDLPRRDGFQSSEDRR